MKRLLGTRQSTLASWLRMTSVYERAMYNTIHKELAKTAGEAARVYEAGKPVQIAIDSHEVRMKTILVASYKAIYPAFGLRISDSVKSAGFEIEKKAGIAMPVMQLFESIMIGFAEILAAEHVQMISDTTKAQINAAIQDGIDNGESRGVIANLVRDYTGGTIARQRALVIATTEVHTIASKSSHEMIKAMDIPGMRRGWISTEDSITRPDHILMDKKDPITLDEPYIVGGAPLMFPGDPSGPAEQTINCRCTEEYIF